MSEFHMRVSITPRSFQVLAATLIVLSSAGGALAQTLGGGKTSAGFDGGIKDHSEQGRRTGPGSNSGIWCDNSGGADGSPGAPPKITSDGSDWRLIDSPPSDDQWWLGDDTIDTATDRDRRRGPRSNEPGGTLDDGFGGGFGGGSSIDWLPRDHIAPPPGGFGSTVPAPGCVVAMLGGVLAVRRRRR
jgi:hypothetical protein